MCFALARHFSVDRLSHVFARVSRRRNLSQGVSRCQDSRAKYPRPVKDNHDEIIREIELDHMRVRRLENSGHRSSRDGGKIVIPARTELGLRRMSTDFFEIAPSLELEVDLSHLAFSRFKRHARLDGIDRHDAGGQEHQVGGEMICC